jgi:serine/threonine protein kinase
MLNICEDIALGMNYLHSRKVLHCDLKSSNVLVIYIKKDWLKLEHEIMRLWSK